MAALRKILNRRREQKRARDDMAVLGCLHQGDVWVLDMWQRLGGGVSAIYMALYRLERQGLVVAEFVPQPSGPPRRLYALTGRQEEVA
jgi:DNA-binding PadR family transcriptional regulator